MNPRFSICIPCFNHGRYIGQTIQSVLDQSYTDFEIIIADNASTDDSLSIIRGFRDPRIRVIENRYNIGFAPNLQRVTESAAGEFVNLLSSDDLMESDALSIYADILTGFTNHHELLLMSQCWQIDGDDNVTSFITRREESLAPHRVRTPTLSEIQGQQLFDVIDGERIFNQCMQALNTAGMFCSVVYSRCLWETVEGYNSTQIINPDMHFTMKTLRQNPQVIYVNRPLYRYRRHEMGQGAQQARQGALKMQVDNYKYTIEYDDHWLEPTHVSPSEQQSVFVKRDCIKYGFMKMKDAQWLDASRLFAFGWATYPRHMLRLWSAWFLLLLLLLGPVGILAAKTVWMVHRLRIPELRLPATVTGSNAIVRSDHPSTSN